MFVVLEIEENSGDFFARLAERISPKKPELLKIAVRSGAPFFILRVRRHHGEIPWNEVRFTAGRCAQRLLVPKGTAVPSDSGVQVFSPQILPFRMAFNTAVDIIKRANTDPRLLSVGILDRDGELADRIDSLAPLSSVIRAVTEKSEAYEAASDRLMKSCGASVVAGNDIGLLKRCDMIICREGDDIPFEDTVIFTAGSKEKRRNIFYGTSPQMPEEYRKLMPENTDEMSFLSALYEMCGVRAVGELQYKSLYLEDRKINIYEAAEALREKTVLQFRQNV